MEQPRKKSRTRWPVLFVVSGTVDIVQIVIDFTGVGVVVSEILEGVTPFLLLGLFKVYKINILTNPKRLGSMFVSLTGDAITGGFAPFWILDVYYIYRDVQKTEAIEDAEQQQEMLLKGGIRQPLYKDGTRAAPRQSKTVTSTDTNGATYRRNINLGPAVVDGIRQPGTGNTRTSNTGQSSPSRTGSTREESPQSQPDEPELMVK
jgi:hypothetical protein